MLNSKRAVAAFVLLLPVCLSLRASYIIGPTGASPIFPSVGTPKFVRAATAVASGSATSVAASFGTLPVIGDVVVVPLLTIGSPTFPIPAVTDNQSGLYSRILVAGTSGNPNLTFWCSPVITSSGTFTVTATLPGALFQGILPLEYSGASCNGDKVASAVGATSPYSCGTITTSNANDIVFAFLGLSGGGGVPPAVTFTAPTGFTARASLVDNLTKIPLASIADNIQAATGSFTPTYSVDVNSGNSPCFTAALMSN